jgi:hypothetical protein
MTAAPMPIKIVGPTLIPGHNLKSGERRWSMCFEYGVLREPFGSLS